MDVNTKFNVKVPLNVSGSETPGQNMAVYWNEGSGSFELTASLGGGGMMSGFSINMNGSKKFGFSFSQDSSKLIIQYRRRPETRNKSKNNDLIGMYVYEPDMEKLVGKEMKMPNTTIVKKMSTSLSNFFFTYNNPMKNIMNGKIK